MLGTSVVVQSGALRVVATGALVAHDCTVRRQFVLFAAVALKVAEELAACRRKHAVSSIGSHMLR